MAEKKETSKQKNLEKMELILKKLESVDIDLLKDLPTPIKCSCSCSGGGAKAASRATAPVL